MSIPGISPSRHLTSSESLQKEPRTRHAPGVMPDFRMGLEHETAPSALVESGSSVRKS